MQRKNKIVKQLTTGIGFLFKKNKITHIQGSASFIDNKKIKVAASEGEKNYTATNFIIATGSTSIAIDAIPVDEKQIVTSTGALALESVPKSLLVIGGGYIGLEMGSVWSRLGSKVTVVEAYGIDNNKEIVICLNLVKKTLNNGQFSNEFFSKNLLVITMSQFFNSSIKNFKYFGSCVPSASIVIIVL